MVTRGPGRGGTRRLNRSEQRGVSAPDDAPLPAALEHGDLVDLLDLVEDLAGDGLGWSARDGAYRRGIEFRGAVGGQQAVGFLLGVGELGVAEPGERRAVEQGVDAARRYPAQIRSAVADRAVAAPRLAPRRGRS